MPHSADRFGQGLKPPPAVIPFWSDAGGNEARGGQKVAAIGGRDFRAAAPEGRCETGGRSRWRLFGRLAGLGKKAFAPLKRPPRFVTLTAMLLISGLACVASATTAATWFRRRRGICPLA